jgi:hypothetical protein
MLGLEGRGNYALIGEGEGFRCFAGDVYAHCIDKACDKFTNHVFQKLDRMNYHYHHT